MIKVTRYQVLGQLLSLSLSLIGQGEPSLEGSFDKLLTLASKPHSSLGPGKVP